MISGKISGPKGRATTSLITSFIVLLVLLSYYLYFQTQLQKVRTRNLRLLATISTQIEQKLMSYVSVLDSLAGFQCPQYAKFEEFLTQETSLQAFVPDSEDDHPSGSRRYIGIGHDPEGRVWLNIHVEKPRETPRPNATSPLARHGCPSDPEHNAQHARVNLNSELKRFMPEGEIGPAFDLVLIATKSGDVIYQPEHAQLHLSNVRTLFDSSGGKEPSSGQADKPKEANAATGRFQRVQETSSVTDVNIAGRSYELYSQPVRFASIRESEMKESEWVIFGLARPFSSYKQALRISFPRLSMAITVLALAFLALPWVRIRFLARHESLRRRDVVFAAGSAFFGMVFALAIPVQGFSNATLEEELERQVRTMADSVQQAIGDELSWIVAYAKELDGRLSDPKRPGDAYIKKNILDDKTQANPYPFMDLAFWTDDRGDQLIKWSAHEQVSPFVNVAPLRFFVRSYRGGPYRIDGQEAFLDGLLAPTTGDYKAILGLKLDPYKPREFAGTDRTVSRLFVVAQPQAIFRAAVPPGFAFAIVDSSSGEVLFHSDFSRNRNENLFTETDENPAVRSVIAARRGELPLVEYRGRRDAMYVTRIEKLRDSPLALVAFADRLYWETAAAETSLIALMLFLLYFACLVISVGIVWLFQRPVRLVELIWPRESLRRRYTSLLITLPVFCLVVLLWSTGVNLAEQTSGAVLAGILAAFVALFTLSPSADIWTTSIRIAGTGISVVVVSLGVLAEGRWTIPLILGCLTVFSCGVVFLVERARLAFGSPQSLVNVYSACVLSIVLAVSVAPAAAFFRTTFRYETALLVKYGQKRFVDALGERRAESDWAEPEHLSEPLQARWNRFEDKDCEVEADASLGRTPGTTAPPAPLGSGMRSHNVCGLYHRSFYDTRLDEEPTRPPYRALTAFEQRLAKAQFALNPIASRMEAIAESQASLSQGGNYWSDERGRIVYHAEAPRVERAAPPEQMADPTDERRPKNGSRARDGAQTQQSEAAKPRRSAVPVRLETTPPRNAGLVRNPALWATVLLVGVLYFYALRSGARRVFVMDWQIPAVALSFALPNPVEGNYLILTRPGDSRMPFDGRQDLRWADLSECAPVGSCEAVLEAAISADQPIVIRHFEYGVSNDVLNESKLKLLETLVLTRHIPVILLSCVDPSYYADKRSGLPDEIRYRWHAVLTRFPKYLLPVEPRPSLEKLMESFFLLVNPQLSRGQRLVLAAAAAREAVPDEHLEGIVKSLPLSRIRSKPELLTLIERHAASYYAHLWDACSGEEQVVLYQIARHRFANPAASEAAFELYRKGLITGDLASWMMNLSFRRFVRSQPEPTPGPASLEEKNLLAIEQSAAVVLSALALPLIVGFLIAHGEGYQSYLGILTAALGALGSVAKLLGGRKPQDA